MNRIKAYISGFLAIALLLAGFAAVAAAGTVSLDYSGTFDYAQAYEVLEIVNAERTSRGLGALRSDARLTEAAMQRAAECAILFDHTRPDGTRFYTVASELSGSTGENIAVGQMDAEEVMTDWMRSQGHRDNILFPSYSSVGVGCFYQDGRIYWAQFFWTGTGDNAAMPENTVLPVSVDVKDSLVAPTAWPDELSLFLGQTDTAGLYVQKVRLDATCYTATCADESVACRASDDIPGLLTAQNVGETTATFTLAEGKSVTLPVTVTFFDDVDTDAWYYGCVRFAYLNGLLNGTSKTRFSPGGAMSRAMLTQALYNLDGAPAVTEDTVAFTDVESGAWYENAVLWAAQSGIAGGAGAGKFNPDGFVTREQVAVMLHNYAQYAGLTPPQARERASFTDRGDISAWAVSAVDAMYCAGVINGRGGGSFDAKGLATRAEVSRMLMSFVEITG